MLDIITSKEQLLKEAIEIDSFLKITMSEDIREVTDRGNDLVVYMARTGKLLADARYHLNTALKNEMMDLLRETAKQAKATATMVNKMVNSAAKEEQYLVDWIERLNRTCTHQVDWCRTMVSKAKEEMRLSGGF